MGFKNCISSFIDAKQKISFLNPLKAKLVESVENRVASENQLSEDVQRLKSTIQELRDSIEEKESQVAEYTEKIVELTEDLNSHKVLFVKKYCCLLSEFCQRIFMIDDFFQEFLEKQKMLTKQLEDREQKLTAENNQLEKDFEEAEDNNEVLKAENEDLKEQLTEKINETGNRELQENCNSLTKDLDEMHKKLHQTEGIFF